MLLGANEPIGFIPTSNAAASRTFYETVLGLHFESDDGFALVFRLGPARGTMLRVVRLEHFTPAPFTIFGWEVHTLETSIDELTKGGVRFLRFAPLEQDERCIWHAPGGAKIAWFADPDGNTLSLSQHKRLG